MIMTELDLMKTLVAGVLLYWIVGVPMWVYNDVISDWITTVTRSVIKIPTVVISAASIVLPLIIFVVLFYPFELIHLR